MADYGGVHKVLLEGLMDAIDEIEKKNYRYARFVLMKAQLIAADVLLQAGDVDNPVFRALTRQENEVSEVDYP